MDRKQKKEFLIIAVGLLVLLSFMSFLLRSCSDQKAMQAQKYISIERKVKNQKDKKMTKTEVKYGEEGDNQLRDLDGNKIENKDMPQKGIQ